MIVCVGVERIPTLLNWFDQLGRAPAVIGTKRA
jgi:hypothetical protein